MHTFGRLGLNLLNIKNRGVKEGDTVIFCFGEIDCRNHVHKHITRNTNYKNVIDRLVINYFNAIKQNISQYKNLTTCIYNVVPPHRYRREPADHPYPFLGTDEQRKMYYTYMNERLKLLCLHTNMIYFDIYDECCDETGFLKKEISDGNVHVKDPSAAENFIRRKLI